MIAASEKTILGRLKEADIVLDVGGWACPFNRANWVIDAESYESRGYYRTIGLPAYQGGEREGFTKDTWVQRDLCGREPWPFADRFFDFSICSQTLEDVRDPLFVCSELIRVSKRGYIEVPSRLAESCRGWESESTAGLSHHRWFVERAGNLLRFTQKFHLIHSRFDLSLPNKIFHSLSEDEKNLTFFWDDTFSFSEQTLHGLETQREWLCAFVREHHSYSKTRLATHGIKDRFTRLVSRLK